MNLLSMLMSGIAGRQPEVSDNEVEGVTVMPTPQPKPAPAPQPAPARNPFTDDYIAAATAAAAAQGKLPRVSGGTDAGLFGFLPQKMQNGRLRDILGAIGDGLLIEGGHAPIYAPRKEARLMGQAMIGYDQDPNAAIERLMQTGAPDSIKTGGTLLTGLQTSEDRRAQRELTARYHDQLDRNRTDQMVNRLGAYVPGVLARAVDVDTYTSAYDRLDQMVKRIDPQSNPSVAFGLPRPEEWTPESTAWIGTTGNQQVNADLRREGYQVRRDIADQSSVDRNRGIDAANYRAELSNSGANYRANLTQDRQDARHNRPSASSGGGRGSGSGLHRRNTGGQGGGAKPKPAAGGRPVVLNRDVTFLKQNDTPANRAAFDKHFGPGSAKKYLGY